MPIKDRAAYWRRYYEKNAEKIAKRRRALYRKDPAYRKKVLVYSRERRRELAEQRAAEPKTHFRIGEAAALVGVSEKTLRRWEEVGHVPPVAAEVGQQRRYTKNQIALLIKLRDRVAATHPAHRTAHFERFLTALQGKWEG